MRITKSDSEFYKPGDESYLEVTELDEVDGLFIDTKKFPPKKAKKGRKIGSKTKNRKVKNRRRKGVKS
jgi:hypothetical protein